MYKNLSILTLWSSWAKSFTLQQGYLKPSPIFGIWWRIEFFRLRLSFLQEAELSVSFELSVSLIQFRSNYMKIYQIYRKCTEELSTVDDQSFAGSSPVICFCHCFWLFRVLPFILCCMETIIGRNIPSGLWCIPSKNYHCRFSLVSKVPRS